jgi:hypothetical protein
MPEPPSLQRADQPGPEEAQDLLREAARVSDVHLMDAEPHRSFCDIAVNGRGIVAEQKGLGGAVDHVPDPPHQRHPPLDLRRLQPLAGHILGEHLLQQLPLVARHGVRVSVEQIVDLGPVARVVVRHSRSPPHHLITRDDQIFPLHPRERELALNAGPRPCMR